MPKKQFKAESKRMLDLMINSIYTHKEIFLREIISNASDAADKLCYIALTNPDVGMSRGDFEIDIAIDRENRVLTVSDNGVGMTREELESNLGTIAHSGSLQFKKEAEDKKDEDIDIIGQFGVGFYSAFMVSEKVTVVSRAYGDETAWVWESFGADGYTLAEGERDRPGTDVIMHIKKNTDDEDYDQFLNEYTLVKLIKKYSDYIRFPIKMEREKSRLKPKKNEKDEDSYETYREIETVNSMIPIWQRKKSEVSDEDINTFYKEKFFDFEDPIKVIHTDVEGVVSYKALLFIPSKAAYDYYTKEYKKGLQLYSSGVLIMDKCEELVPEHFRFVRGVVDSPDLSLNISRELLQHNRQLRVIASNIEKKIQSELLKMLGDEREKYENFFKAFGLQLKYGVLADFGASKDILKDLLLFTSSASDKLTTLAEYAERMDSEQKFIYYATGETAQMIAALPQAELVREKGYEILYFTSEADEFTAQALMNYNDKPFKSINDDDLGLDSETDDKDIKKLQKENKDLLDFVKDTLGDAVREVRISKKLRSHPVCLTAGGQMSFEMEKYFNQIRPEGGAKAERILELNPTHPVFEKLKSLMSGDKDKAAGYAKILYHQAELLAGLPIGDIAEYSDLVFELM